MSEGERWDDVTMCKLTRRTNSRLQSTKYKMGYKSADQFVADVLTLVGIMDWRKGDMATLIESARRSQGNVQFFEGTAKTDDEIKEKIGVRPGMRKTSEFEESGPPVKGDVKCKDGQTIKADEKKEEPEKEPEKKEDDKE